MKKLLCMCLTFCMIFVMAVPAGAIDKEEYLEGNDSAHYLLPKTYEDAMPVISADKTRMNSIGTENTLSVPARREWVSDTTQVLESTYGTEVTDVYETESTVVFEFEEPDPETFEFGKNYVMKEIYMKPEAQSSAETKATKISYVYGFGEGMYENDTFEVDRKEGLWSNIKDAIINVVGIVWSDFSVAAAAYNLCGLATDFFDVADTVKVDSLAQYYFINKVGMVQDPLTNMWVPLAYVGLRKDFRNLYIYKDINGYLLKVGEDVTVPDNFVNPTNADETHTKAHFWDDEWIMEKALSIFGQDGPAGLAYFDVFLLISGGFHDEYPSA